jgi:hypothetical protein
MCGSDEYGVKAVLNTLCTSHTFRFALPWLPNNDAVFSQHIHSSLVLSLYIESLMLKQAPNECMMWLFEKKSKKRNCMVVLWMACTRTLSGYILKLDIGSFDELFD